MSRRLITQPRRHLLEPTRNLLVFAASQKRLASTLPTSVFADNTPENYEHARTWLANRTIWSRDHKNSYQIHELISRRGKPDNVWVAK